MHALGGDNGRGRQKESQADHAVGTEASMGLSHTSLRSWPESNPRVSHSTTAPCPHRVYTLEEERNEGWVGQTNTANNYNLKKMLIRKANRFSWEWQVKKGHSKVVTFKQAITEELLAIWRKTEGNILGKGIAWAKALRQKSPTCSQRNWDNEYGWNRVFFEAMLVS